MGGYRTSLDDVAGAALVAGTITVGTTAVLACVGGSNLADRQELNIYNPLGNPTIYYGTDSVTASETGGGMPIEAGVVISLQYGSSINIYLIAGSAGNTVVIHEAA